MTCYCHFCMESSQYIERHQKIDNCCCIKQLGITLRTFWENRNLLNVFEKSLNQERSSISILICKFSFVVHSIVFADD